MSLSLTADTAVCPSVPLGKVFHVQIMPAHIQGQISTVILCVRKYMAVGFRLWTHRAWGRGSVVPL